MPKCLIFHVFYLLPSQPPTYIQITPVPSSFKLFCSLALIVMRFIQSFFMKILEAALWQGPLYYFAYVIVLPSYFVHLTFAELLPGARRSTFEPNLGSPAKSGPPSSRKVEVIPATISIYCVTIPACDVTLAMSFLERKCRPV